MKVGSISIFSGDFDFEIISCKISIRLRRINDTTSSPWVLFKKITNALVIEMEMKNLILAITIIIAMYNCNLLAVDVGETLLMGSSLSGNQTIISKNGTFALGFFNPKGTNNWYIGIWYAEVSQKAIVWVAIRENPVRSMPGVLNFSSDGRLRLFNRDDQLVWSTNNGGKASDAILMDSGNLVMLDAQEKSEIVWESFAHRGDTWLPGMKMWKGMKLTSWKSSVDLAIGLFSYGIGMSPRKVTDGDNL
ncbi:hypothetical protein SUGI_1090110 [Cryptomeria japonica]|nr:hypothetical protein SUGI_1090110 [Cryptomeria japonica]